MQAFERVAVKYAEYVKTKLMFSASIQEMLTGKRVSFWLPVMVPPGIPGGWKCPFGMQARRTGKLLFTNRK